MTFEERKQMIQAARERRDKIMDGAAGDYAQSDADANANFKRLGEVLEKVLNGPRPVHYKVWAIYFMKHLDTLFGWLSGNDVKREGVVSRIDDLVNYLDIAESMMREDGLAK